MNPLASLLKVNHIRLIPLYVSIIIWHLKCIYEGAIVHPFWWVLKIPADPQMRLCHFIAIELLLVLLVCYQLALTKWYEGYFPLFTFGILIESGLMMQLC